MHTLIECQYKRMDMLGIEVDVVKDNGGLINVWIPFEALKDSYQIDIFADPLEMEVNTSFLVAQGIIDD